MEMDFYSSLSKLSTMFDISLPETKYHGFPYNVSSAMELLQKPLKQACTDWQDIRLVQDDGGRVFFARQQRFDTGMTLYYIAVEPLFYMLRDKKRKAASKILLSVFAYLFQVADIPYHRHEGNYLCYTYEMLSDWKLQDDEDDLAFTQAFSRMEFIGDSIARKIQNPLNLLHCSVRLKAFRAKDAFDQDCAKIAEKAFALLQQYPEMRVHSKCQQGRLTYEDDERQIELDQYVSFYGSARGELSELLIETVNADLQEFGAIDEPMIYVPLEGIGVDGNPFDFESRLFSLLEDLSILLNDYNY